MSRPLEEAKRRRMERTEAIKKHRIEGSMRSMCLDMYCDHIEVGVNPKPGASAWLGRGGCGEGLLGQDKVG